MVSQKLRIMLDGLFISIPKYLVEPQLAKGLDQR
jgi:hypothetical protein